MIISIRFSYLFLCLAILKIRFMKEKIIYVFMLLIVIVSCTEEESFDEYGVRILKKNGVVFAMDSRLSLNLDGTRLYGRKERECVDVSGRGI